MRGTGISHVLNRCVSGSRGFQGFGRRRRIGLGFVRRSRRFASGSHSRNGFAHREWQKLRERNEALDCYVYARAAAAAAGLDRFEERHWRELEKQLGGKPDSALPDSATQTLGAAPQAGPACSKPQPARRVVRSRWMT